MFRNTSGMSQTPWGQNEYGVRFDWGAAGAACVADPDGVLVVVDVLSFTTSVTVAVERGVAVYPAAWRDERAGELARDVGAVLAVGRSEATAEHPWCLSPAALRGADAPERLVLPSPNGSAIAAAAGGVVVAACLRNASAVGAWLSERYGSREAPVTVIAAGERWPDGSLRPAVEDLLGAGAVLAALADGGVFEASPEAELARAAYAGVESVADAVRRCGSGVELAFLGFGADVEVAVEVDATADVPVLVGGAFQPA
jgi:2-phosphosulfolactate phosphatase